MSGSMIVTRTVNTTSFDVDKGSYERVVAQIRKVGNEWEKVQAKTKSKQKNQFDQSKATIQAKRLEAQRLNAQNKVNAAKEKELALTNKAATQRKKDTADQLRAEARLAKAMENRFKPRKGATPDPLPTAAEIQPHVAGILNASSPQAKRNVQQAAKQAMREQMKLAADMEKAEKRRIQYARKRYLTIRTEAYKIQNIEGLTNAERAEGILKMRRIADLQAKETLNAQETRFELRKITQELQKQARTRARMANQRTHGGGFGGSRGMGGNKLTAGVGVGMAGAAGAAAAGLLAVAGASMAAAATLRESFQRNQEYSGLREQGVTATMADAILMAANQKGAGISLDKLQQQFVDYLDKQGDLSLGEWKVDKKTGERSYGGGGELADVINLVEKRQTGAGTEILKRLQSVDFQGYLSMLRELEKSYKLTAGEMTLFAEFVDDGSKTLRAFDESGKISAKALESVKSSSLYLSDAQREQVTKLQSDMMLLGQASVGLADNFTLGFAETFASSDDLTKAMENLAPLMKGLGSAAADVLNSFAKLYNWLTIIFPSVGGDRTGAGVKESYTGSRDMTPKSEQPKKGFWDNLFDLDSKAFLPQEYGGKSPNAPKPLQVPDNFPALAPFKDLSVSPQPVPTFNPSSLTTSMARPTNQTQTIILDQKPLKVDISVNDGNVKDLVNVAIDERELQTLNMMMSGGNT